MENNEGVAVSGPFVASFRQGMCEHRDGFEILDASRQQVVLLNLPVGYARWSPAIHALGEHAHDLVRQANREFTEPVRLSYLVDWIYERVDTTKAQK
jgi:hypothetical protein